MARYSFSQIQTYQTCPLKYKYEKIDNIKPPFEENPFLILGSSCHSALEWLYNQVRQFVIPTKDEVIDEYTKDRKDRIIQLRQNTHQIIDERQIEVFYDRGVEYISNYYDTYQPFSNEPVLDTEQNISFVLDGDISFSGKVDRLDIIGDEIIINDYKTNQKIPDDKHDHIKEQINLYGYGVKQLYASKIKTVKGRVYYLHFNRSFEWEITDEVIETVKSKYVELSQEIEVKKALYNKGNTEIFEPKV